MSDDPEHDIDLSKLLGSRVTRRDFLKDGGVGRGGRRDDLLEGGAR